MAFESSRDVAAERDRLKTEAAHAASLIERLSSGREKWRQRALAAGYKAAAKKPDAPPKPPPSVPSTPKPPSGSPPVVRAAAKTAAVQELLEQPDVVQFSKADLRGPYGARVQASVAAAMKAGTKINWVP